MSELLLRIKKRNMLNIKIHETPTEETWILEGRLVWPWVCEVRANWSKTLYKAGRRQLVVNVDQVTSIDKIGERLLLSMSNEGARLIASDLNSRKLYQMLGQQRSNSGP